MLLVLMILWGMIIICWIFYHYRMRHQNLPNFVNILLFVFISQFIECIIGFIFWRQCTQYLYLCSNRSIAFGIPLFKFTEASKSKLNSSEIVVSFYLFLIFS
jgi:hypothetical protein